MIGTSIKKVRVNVPMKRQSLKIRKTQMMQASCRTAAKISDFRLPSLTMGLKLVICAGGSGSNNVDTQSILGYRLLIQSSNRRSCNMRGVVKKWGNSASVRIPVAVLRAVHLDLDEPVDVREESGRIVIEPVRRKEYNLAELVRGITRENFHAEVAFGGPVGKEAW